VGRTVKIFHKGELVAEIPQDMFPLEIRVSLTNGDQQWESRSYTWKLSYHKDEHWKNRFDLPKGMQLQIVALFCFLPLIERFL